MTDIDAIVIGSGHNGLVAANMLADAGWSVVVLEAMPTPGGAVRSAELAAEGFHTDVCGAFFPFAACSLPLRRLGLAEYGLSFSRAPVVLTHVLPDGREVALSPDPRQTAESVEQFAAGDGDRWLQLYDEWQRWAPSVLQALFTPFPPIAALGYLAWNLPPSRALRLARQGLLSTRRMGRELFRGEGAQVLMAGCALHTDLGPDDAASGVYGWLLAMVGQQIGFPAITGGAGALTDALVARLRARGGEVVCDTAVSDVSVRGGAAVGVRTAAGELWRAERAVIADVAAPTLYGDLVGEKYLPRRLVNDTKNFTWDHATIKVDWAVEGDVGWSAPRSKQAGVIHLGADLNGLASYAAELANGKQPLDPFLVVGQMTTADPSRSPAGTQALWAYTHLPHGGQMSPDATADFVDRMERKIEHYAPGFRARIKGRYVHGPQRMQAGNPSLVGGAINGGTAAIHQQLIFRPTPGLGRADTPVDRLYLASSGAHPSGGVHGGAGANAARAALARAKPVTGWLYGAGIRAAHALIHRE